MTRNIRDDIQADLLEARILLIEDDADHADLIQRCLAQIETITLYVTHCTGLQDALENITPDGPDLILLDYRLRSESGLEFLQDLRAQGDKRPVVVLTSQGSEYIAVDMMRAGADDYIVKADLDPEVLQKALIPLIIHSRTIRKIHNDTQEVISRLRLLTPREREVLTLIIQGQTNKQIAQTLNRSENTIKIHRSRVMQKLNAHTPADLVRMVLAADPTAAIPLDQNSAHAL